MKKAQIPIMITILNLSVLVMVNTSVAREDPGEIMDGEIRGRALKSLIKQTEVASFPRLVTEVTLVEIYNENLELIAFGTAHESRIMKLVHQCDWITTITESNFSVKPMSMSRSCMAAISSTGLLEFVDEI